MNGRGDGFALVLALVSLGASCGGPNNAILELEVQLPAEFMAVDRRMTHVAFAARRGATRDFADSWSVSTDEPLGPAPRTVTASVVAEDRFEEVLRFKVVFCDRSPCTDEPGAVSHWFEIEEPFRVGAYTGVELRIDDPASASTAPTTIGRCFVRGCGAVPPPSELTGYCTAAGTHPCD